MATIADLTTNLSAPATGDKLVARDVSEAGATKDKYLLLSQLGVLSLAQSWSAKQTFAAGIDFGNETLSIYDEGTWTPAITASSSNPTVTYTQQIGQYVRIGKLVFANFSIQINAYSGGSGNIRVSLPVAVSASFSAHAAVALSGVDTPASTVGLVFAPTFNQSYGDLRAVIDNGTLTNLDTTMFAAGDSIRATAMYMTD